MNAPTNVGLVAGAVLFWLFAWALNEWLVRRTFKGSAAAVVNVAVPLLFGLSLLVLWEGLTRGFGVPQVLLPPPSAIWARITASTATLWADFNQTFIKSVLPGYAIGCTAGLLAAIAIDRSPFLKKGLLPIGNFVSALPLVGIAPIMVMWFGFDWHSKAAVVVVMTFFPMLVNAVAGLNASSRMEQDLMRTYAAGSFQTLLKLRLPAAWPFIFNALKINSTLALIGAIVAEFFGTPVVGMGFRISAAIGRLNVDMVWAEIAVAALAGSVFYGLVALIERRVTFWHPSVRGGKTR
jgi:NitT/TauT family transport system permease protein